VSEKKKNSLAFFGVKYFPSKGGVSRTTENLIRNLKDEYEITIYCYTHSQATTNVPGVNVVQFDEVPIKGLGVFIYLVKCYFHLMFKANYDLLHVRKIDAAFFLPLLSIKYKRILATSHESPYVRDKWGPIAKLYFKMNERIFVRSKARLTVISQPLSVTYKERYGRDVLFIPNGVEPLKDLSGSEAEKVLSTHGISKPYVSFGARRIMSTKGVHTMLKALGALNFEKDILIAGELNHTGNYLKELEVLGKGLKVHMTDYIGNKATLLDLIGQSEVFVFPSETEGMSIMLLEVALSGTPIIASDIPENTAVFDDTEVTFFKDKDYVDLAEKLKWYYANRDIANKKALKAKQKVLTQYSGDAMTQYYREQYELLLADKK
jgi:glycosyltransferase involved in cell wall biosynthesis